MKKTMKNLKIAGLIAAMILVALPASASVSVNTAPVSLITSATEASASSDQIALFKFAYTANASETLSEVEVSIANDGSSTASGSDLDALAVYKDDGDGIFETNGQDLLAGSEADVNIGSATAITTGSNNSLDGSMYFVTLTTASTWSDSAPGDEVKAYMATDALTFSANSPTTTAIVTSTITADTTGPLLTS